MKRIVIAMSLVLALILGCVAFAEATSTIPDQTVEETTVPTAPAEENNDQAALEEALKAYRAAKEEKYVSDLEEELAGYVAAGSLTQEQADLILNSVKERLAAKNGECPNCGYKFQKSGKMGGCRMQDGRQMPDAQSGATPQYNQRGSRMIQGGQMPGQQQNGQRPQMPSSNR